MYVSTTGRHISLSKTSFTIFLFWLVLSFPTFQKYYEIYLLLLITSLSKMSNILSIHNLTSSNYSLNQYCSFVQWFNRFNSVFFSILKFGFTNLKSSNIIKNFHYIFWVLILVMWFINFRSSIYLSLKWLYTTYGFPSLDNAPISISIIYLIN